MKYKWKEKELINGLNNAKNNNDDATMDNYRFMLDVLKNIDLTYTSPNNNSYDDMYNNYSEDMEFITDEIFDLCASIYKIANNEDELFTQIDQKKINLSNKDLIDLGHEIISELNDSRALQIYQEITRQDNHYLNIVKDNYEEEHDDSYGITILDHVKKKSYILLKRRYTAFDIETFIHEVLHSIMYKYKNRKFYMCNYFEELEGKFGERITSNYLKEHDMNEWAYELESYSLYDILYNSYMLYLNDVLFYTSKKKRFNCKAATKLIKKETNYKDTYIDKDNIPYICNINGFNTITNIIDYLICLELNNKYSIQEQFLFIKDIAKKESFCFYNHYLKKLFDFYNDNYCIQQEKNEIDKRLQLIK